jgi:hypothetical protein
MPYGMSAIAGINLGENEMRDDNQYDNHLIEMLLETNYSVREMARELNLSEAWTSQRIKLLGLDWIPRRNRQVSRGQAALTQIMKKLIPGEEIVNEYHIGEQLRLDVYCPRYKLAAEFHGRQHYEFVAHFHDSYDDFIRSQQRDDRKIQLCAEAGIALVTFRYCDKLTEDCVFDRLLCAMQEAAAVDGVRIDKKPKYSAKNSPHYEQMRAKRRAYERELRRKIKQERKEREQNRTSSHEDGYELGSI